MNGNYTRFMHLVQGAATGLLQQIPIVGPMLQAVLAGIEQRHLEEEIRHLSRLLQRNATLTSARITAKELERDLNFIVEDEENAGLASMIFQAEAEAANHFVGGRPPQDGGGHGPPRFLYLAANNYASSARTAQIAANLGFLWRSYHADGGARVNKVGEIRVGSVIALAYRSPNQFRLLLPLIVTASGGHTLPINDAQCPYHAHAPHAPFVVADPWLTQILVQEGYGPDPIFNAGGRRLHTGLNVKVLVEHVVPHQPFASPGMTTIWHYDHQNVPAAVTNWIGRL